jgi:uncharacterized protein
VTCIDVNAFVGTYPFRDLGGWDHERLLEEMERLGISESWVSHLGAIFWRDPMEGTGVLEELAARQPRLRPVPAVHPGLPHWEEAVTHAVSIGAPCVRCDPLFFGLAPTGPEVRNLLHTAAAAGLPVLLAVRLEDVRQRHPNDVAGDLTPAMLRALIRSDPDVRLIVTHADRECVEQVHFGSTPTEGARILWDISWLWGPPEDHLAILLETVGVFRFTFGTGTPLRLPGAVLARLDLLDPGRETRARLEEGNLREFLRRD